MKRFSIIPLFVAVALATGCDKITHPIQKFNGPDTTAAPLTRKVMLEDYTGHLCGNCPAAADVAENLSEQYHDKLVVVAVHAGFFSRTLPEYTTSYRCEVGNAWDATTGFAVSNVGNPNGMVNRKDYGAGLIQKEGKWPTYVSQALNEEHIVGLEIIPDYDPASRILNTKVKAKFTAGYASDVMLNLVITEDSLKSPQLKYLPDGSSTKISEYVFNHVLRDAINGSWGSDLLKAPIAAGDSVTADFNNFTLKANFNDNNVSIVGFAYDKTTKEVLQVEKIKIR